MLHSDTPIVITDDTITPIDTVDTVSTDTVDTVDTETAETVQSIIHAFDINHHDPLLFKTLINPKLTQSTAFKSLKSIIDDDSKTLTLATDCELSYNSDDRTYTIALIDNKSSICKRSFEPLDVDYDIDVNVPKIASHALTRGKYYLRSLALTANILRAVRPLTNERVFTVSIESTRTCDLVVPYTSSIQSIALSVSRLITSCDTTSLFIYNAIMNAFDQPTLDLDVLDCDIKLPALKRLKTCYHVATK